MDINGQTLIGWGFKPGRHFQAAIARANELRTAGQNDEAIVAAVRELIPVEVTIPMRAEPLAYGVFLGARTDEERANLAGVIRHMDELMRVPTIEAGAVMPNACPSGSALGTIPVGGAVAARNAIHPGFHSADICCSMAITVIAGSVDPKTLFDAVQAVTHFGSGGRRNPVACRPGSRTRSPPTLPLRPDRQGRRRLRQPGGRQPLRLRRTPRVDRAGRPCHAPRIPRARRRPLQEGHGGREAPRGEGRA